MPVPSINGRYRILKDLGVEWMAKPEGAIAIDLQNTSIHGGGEVFADRRGVLPCNEREFCGLHRAAADRQDGHQLARSLFQPEPGVQHGRA